MAPPPHLDPSELGTRAYWDKAYTTERANFASNADDEGTVWFSDAGAEERMLGFLEDLADAGTLRKSDDQDKSEGDSENNNQSSAVQTGIPDVPLTRFLDLGTGNGHLLFALREDGWEGDMVGVDYSTQSISLAAEIGAAKGPQYADIAFSEWDILASSPGAWVADGFDLVLDKGTFDAVCLAQETDANGVRVCEGYRARVEPLVKKGGRFLITSCNWTAEELRAWFEAEGSAFVFEKSVKYPSFTFGGQTGTSVCTLCFQKR